MQAVILTQTNKDRLQRSSVQWDSHSQELLDTLLELLWGSAARDSYHRQERSRCGVAMTIYFLLQACQAPSDLPPRMCM